MKEEIKLLWVDALNSGRFTKGMSRLYERTTDDYYCCLGVLCQLAEEAGIATSFVDENGDVIFHGIDVYESGSCTVLPTSVMTWAGLTDEDPRVDTPEGNRSLSSINDDLNRPRTFPEIAELIAASSL